MSTTSAKITLHMVASLDGFIARKDGDISWMNSTDSYEKGIVLTEADVEDFLKSIDCYVLGSRTYEHALELGWPYGETPVIVLTSRDLKRERDSVEFYSGDLLRLVRERLQARYQNIWLGGGAMVAREFLQLDLVDEIVLSVLPIVLGDGIPFFDHIGRDLPLHLLDVKAHRDGMVELRYEVRRD